MKIEFKFTKILEKIKDDKEEVFKFRTRLFGNILFVGELFKRDLLAETIVLSVFDMLLATTNKDQEKLVNDDTVEGACTLMNKIGHIIDEKLIKIEKEKQ